MDHNLWHIRKWKPFHAHFLPAAPVGQQRFAKQASKTQLSTNISSTPLLFIAPIHIFGSRQNPGGFRLKKRPNKNWEKKTQTFKSITHRRTAWAREKRSKYCCCHQDSSSKVQQREIYEIDLCHPQSNRAGDSFVLSFLLLNVAGKKNSQHVRECQIERKGSGPVTQVSTCIENQCFRATEVSIRVLLVEVLLFSEMGQDNLILIIQLLGESRPKQKLEGSCVTFAIVKKWWTGFDRAKIGTSPLKSIDWFDFVVTPSPCDTSWLQCKRRTNWHKLAFQITTNNHPSGSNGGAQSSVSRKIH